EMLDQLLADEGSDVRMIEDVVESRLEVRSRGETCRHHHIVQKGLRSVVVVNFDTTCGTHDHRIAVIGNAGSKRRREDPAPQDSGELLHCRLLVGRDGLAVWPELRGSVRIQLHQANTE